MTWQDQDAIGGGSQVPIMHFICISARRSWTKTRTCPDCCQVLRAVDWSSHQPIPNLVSSTVPRLPGTPFASRLASDVTSHRRSSSPGATWLKFQWCFPWIKPPRTQLTYTHTQRAKTTKVKPTSNRTGSIDFGHISQQVCTKKWALQHLMVLWLLSSRRPGNFLPNGVLWRFKGGLPTLLFHFHFCLGLWSSKHQAASMIPPWLPQALARKRSASPPSPCPLLRKWSLQPLLRRLARPSWLPWQHRLRPPCAAIQQLPAVVLWERGKEQWQW